MTKNITPNELRRQIEAYAKEYPHYKAYAGALKRVLAEACAVSIPEAIVQARPKGIASFAEKCVRKYERYPDAVNQMTDLCGARVILPTLEHVRAVQQFVESNFEVVERDDKTSLLGENQFGYRDMHYLLQLKPERSEAIGFTPEDRRMIGKRIAELQVRSVVQHAWADILHDRMYKTPLKLSKEAKRTGALLAAIMEDGDRSFNLLAGQLDNMATNYSAYASRENAEKEIQTQTLLLNCSAKQQRAKIALRLVRLIAAKGEWQNIIATLEPFTTENGPLKNALRLELGHAVCRLHRSDPKSSAYRKGQILLEQVAQECADPDLTAIPDLCRIRNLQSRANARLGWSWEPIEGELHRARSCYREAVELEPGNPYYLADMLGFEIKFSAGADLVAGFRASIKSALATCRQHAEAGTELPAAFFTAGRLNMLLGDYYSALNDYASAIRHWLSKDGCMTCNLLEDEIAWLHRIHSGKALPAEFRWAEDVLLLAQMVESGAQIANATSNSLKAPVLVISGGAASLKSDKYRVVESLLREALPAFQGTIISGGSTSGVPGCVGNLAGELAQRKCRQFELVGYIPHSLPGKVEKDSRYDQLIQCNSVGFTPAQVLQGWKDLMVSRIKSSDVLLLGFGGGKISAFEYRLALALGSTVGVVAWKGDAAQELLSDPLWSSAPNLFPLPEDAQTVRAFVVRDGYQFNAATLDKMGREFHARYLAANNKKIKPESLKGWDDLPDTYKTANIQQAAYAIRILEVAGFGVRKAKGRPVIRQKFTKKEIELMAALEHGRWNIERLRDGWRHGPRDDAKKSHDCIVPWAQLPDGPDGVKRFDRDAVCAFPEILAKAGMEVFRK